MRRTRRERPTFEVPGSRLASVPPFSDPRWAESSLSADERGVVKPSAPREQSFLGLHVRGQSRAIPIRNVREIAQADSVESVPHGASWIRGALSVRGSRVPVVDLAVRLGQPPTLVGSSTCVVIAEIETHGRAVRVGLLADEDSRVTSARLPRWAVLSVDDLLDYEELRDASVTGPDEARAPALGPGASIGGVTGTPRTASRPGAEGRPVFA